VSASGLFGWRGAYGLEAALALTGLIAFPLAIRHAPARPPALNGRLDGVGLVLVSGAALAVQLLLGWPAGLALTLPVSILLGTAYWWHAGRSPAPIFSRAHLAGRRLLPYHFSSAMAFLGAWGLSTILPLVVRDGLHASAATSALALTLSASGWLGGSLLTAGPLGGRSPRQLLVGAFGVQFLLLLAGAAVLSTTTTGLLVVAGSVGLVGGVANNASLGLATTAVPAADVGRSLAALQFVRSVGSGAGGGAAAALAVALGPLPGLRTAQLGAAVLTATAALIAYRASRVQTSEVASISVSVAAGEGNPSTPRRPGNNQPQLPAIANVATPPSTMAPAGPSS
jgi:hypothetical protein